MTNQQAVAALRQLIAQLESGAVQAVAVTYATQTAAVPPYAPTGQETVTVTVRRAG